MGGDLLRVSKTNRLSTVHRRVRMDYIGVKRVDAAGEIVGELRLLGLFTSKAYMEPASRIPLLHRKLAQIVAAEDLFEGSHDHKLAVELFESFPKDELFTADWQDLRRSVVSLLELQEQVNVRLIARVDLEERIVALVVAMPRDRFNAELRLALGQALPGALRRRVGRLPPVARRVGRRAHPLHRPRARRHPRRVAAASWSRRSPRSRAPGTTASRSA